MLFLIALQTTEHFFYHQLLRIEVQIMYIAIFRLCKEQPSFGVEIASIRATANIESYTFI